MDAKPIIDPPCPYTGSIPDGLTPGKMVRIQGIAQPNGNRFDINLQTGSSTSPRDDTALHMSVRLEEGYIARNHYTDADGWGDEEGSGSLPIGPGQRFEIIILAEADHYKIAVNGQHFCEFKYRIPINKVTHLHISGTCDLTLISWESIIPTAPPQGQDTAAQASQLNAPGPQGGPPPQFGGYDMRGPTAPSAPGYGPPPGGYFPVPQGPPGGPMGGAAPPPPGYPGPTRGNQQQQGDGFENFLASAQSVLANAIQSGAAENLIRGILSSGSANQQTAPGGFQPHNAQYGIYPHLPQQQQQQQPQMGGGGGGLLDALFGGQGQRPSQGPQYGAQGPQYGAQGPQYGAQGPQYGAQGPQYGGQQPAGGGLGSLLSSLATQVLTPTPPRDGQRH